LSGAGACRPGAPLESVAAWANSALLALLVDESTASVVGIGDLEGEDVVDGVVASGTAWSSVSTVSHCWLVAENGVDLREFKLAGDGVDNTARGSSGSGEVLILAGGRVGSGADGIVLAPCSPSVVSSTIASFNLLACVGAVFVDSALVLSESSLNSTTAVRTGVPGGPQVPVSGSAAVLSASRVVGIARDVSLFAEIVKLSVSDDADVGADGVAFGVVLGPLSPLRLSVDSACLGLGEDKSVAVLVGGVDTLSVASVGSSEDSLASALPDLVVAIFELRTVAIGNELPVGVDTVDGGDNLGLGLGDAAAHVLSASSRCFFVAILGNLTPCSPGIVLVAAWEGDVGFAGDDGLLALTLGVASLGRALSVVVWAAACLVVNKAIVLKRCVLKFNNFSRSDALVGVSAEAGSRLDSLQSSSGLGLAAPLFPLAPAGPVRAGVVNWVVASAAIERVAVAVDASDAVEASSKSVADSRAADTPAAGPGAPWKPKWSGRTAFDNWSWCWSLLTGNSGPPGIGVHCLGRSH